MPLTDDPWIKRHSPIESEKLHALGYITFTWNNCEHQLFTIFSIILQIPAKLAWLIVHDMGDVALCDRIKAYLKQAVPKEDDQSEDANSKRAIAALLLNAIAAYDVCRKNRNSLTHFQLKLEADGRFVLARQKGPDFDRVPFPDSITDLRRVAEEIWGLYLYLNNIAKFLLSVGTEKQLPLPQTVRPPELLWKPTQQTPPKPKRPR